MTKCQFHAISGEDEDAICVVRVTVTPYGKQPTDDVEYDACAMCAESILEQSLGEDGHNPPARDNFDRSPPKA